nr:hypothetical protein [Pseudomonas sp.]
MQDKPTPDQLLQAVAQFLRERVMPQLDAQTAFHTRVSANVLDIVARQWQNAPSAQAQELLRLRELLGRDGTLEELNEELCARIARGELTTSSPGLVDHLWQITMDKLAVDQPRYETYRRINQP